MGRVKERRELDVVSLALERGLEQSASGRSERLGSNRRRRSCCRIRRAAVATESVANVGDLAILPLCARKRRRRSGVRSQLFSLSSRRPELAATSVPAWGSRLETIVDAIIPWQLQTTTAVAVGGAAPELEEVPARRVAQRAPREVAEEEIRASLSRRISPALPLGRARASLVRIVDSPMRQRRRAIPSWSSLGLVLVQHSRRLEELSGKELGRRFGLFVPERGGGEAG